MIMQQDVPMIMKISMFTSMISLIVMLGLTVGVYVIDFVSK